MTAPAKASTFKNVHLMMRPGEIAIGGNGLKAMFADGGTMCVSIDGYLIAPLELFSKRQVNAIRRRLATLAESQPALINSIMGEGK